MHFAKGLVLVAVIAVTTLTANDALAQLAVNLSGTYRCVQGCAAGFETSPAYITQNGPSINMVSESGQSSQAWADWFAPATRIWVDGWNEGAVFSPDGMTIQFDRGAIWQRVVLPDPATVAYCARRYRTYDAYSQTYLASDGLRHPCP